MAEILAAVDDEAAASTAFGADEIVVADLTGAAVQDVEITNSVWSRLAS